MQTILICTVGGSHQPIINAIHSLMPDYVVFVCTDKDPATGRPGSISQINGKGHCIKAHPQDDKPSLPNIPVQAGLDESQFETLTTSADDLDQIYSDCNQAIDRLIADYPEAKLYADYTGGTKSMSAGLIMAALENPDIELQLVTGSRSDLIKVQDGAESSTPASIERIRLHRLTAPYRQSWQRYAYSEAEAGLKSIKTPSNTHLRAQLNRQRELSRAFAEWDNFNHAAALDILQRYAPRLPESMKPYIATVMRLTDKNDSKREAAKLYDLYLNARRRAHQGRYDDATARIYRLIEWSAQWLLWQHCQIKTDNIAVEQIPPEVPLSQNRDGQWQAGLFQAWQLVKYKTHGGAAEFIKEHENTLLNHIKIRNQSILAHGCSPINQTQWQPLQDFMQELFIPMMLKETQAVGIKLSDQLPDQYSELLFQ